MQLQMSPCSQEGRTQIVVKSSYILAFWGCRRYFMWPVSWESFGSVLVCTRDQNHGLLDLYFLSSMIFFSLLSFLDLFGPIWTNLYQLGPILTHFDLYGHLWTYLGLFGVFGEILSYLELFGAIWSHFQLFGAIWSNLYPCWSIWSNF